MGMPRLRLTGGIGVDSDRAFLGPFMLSPKAPGREALLAKLDDVAKQIADGKMDLPRS